MKPTVRDEGRTMEGARAGCAESACNAVDMVKQTGIPPGIYEGCVLLSTRACRIFFRILSNFEFYGQYGTVQVTTQPESAPTQRQVHSGPLRAIMSKKVSIQTPIETPHVHLVSLCVGLY